MSRVKGLAFRSVLRAVTELKGQSTLDQVYARLGPELEQSLRYATASSWYPVEQYVALWNAVQLATGNQADFPRVVGRKCVELDLKLVHKVAFAALSVPTVLGISARLFRTYYDPGQCVSNTIEPGVVRMEIERCIGFNAAMWTELRGASECFAEQASRKPARSELVSGGRTGDTSMIAVVRWGP